MVCAGASCAAPPGEVELDHSTHRNGDDHVLIPPAQDDGEAGSARETVIGGAVSWDRPEVGAISGCTATLIAPEVIITAAHCLGFRSARTPGRYGEFTIYGAGGGDRRSYPIDLYVSYSGGSLGQDDVALMRLAEPVPADVATPARLAREEPARGASMAIWGFGCTRRGTGTDWQKRRYDFLEGAGTDNLCPGDSGGPVMTSGGEVVRINSGYYAGYPGGDIFGEVPVNYDRLIAQVGEWSDWDPDAGGGGGGGGKIPDDDGGMPMGDPCNGYATTCGGCTPIAGCGWCASSGTCVSIDASGSALGSSCGEVHDEPAECAPSGDRCGVYAPFPDFTCWQGGGGFVRCVPGSTPEYLVCPSGYLCRPGSRALWCYRY